MESALYGNDAATVAKNTLVGGVAGGVTGGILAGAAYGIEKGAAAIGNAIKGKSTPPPKPNPVKCAHEGACFVVGTKVLTSLGLKTIEKIRPGDKVLAADPETGRQEEKEVVRTFVKETDTLVHLRIGGEEIVTTENHPFYVDGEGWVTAGELTEEDYVLDSEGRRLQVEEKYVENLEESVKVYNFEVEEYHTYYVGQTGILVHNKCWDDSPIDSMGDYKKGVDIKTVGSKGHEKQVVVSNKDNVYDFTPSEKHYVATENPGKVGEPDSSVDILNRKGRWMTRRWFDENGNAKRDIDLTNHFNPDNHPEVLHEHWWVNGERIE